MKYIIKNCPASYSDEYCKEYTYEDGSVFCKDRIDCLLKQIVEKCMHEAHGDAWQIVRAGDVFLANDILRLLDIQEIEE